MLQKTILSPVSCYGIGVHSGRKTQLTLYPAAENTGIKVRRSDISGMDNIINVDFQSVYETTMSTSVKNGANISISTVEHLMAALWGCGIDNVLIDVDGPEVPIMDGSSKPFVFMIECAGYKIQKSPRKQLKLLKEITIIDGDSEIIAIPAEHQIIDLTIDFSTPVIGKQQLTFNNSNLFKDEIADSRTFGFLKDLDYLLSKGLAKGASLDNTIGIDQDKILNYEGLRHENEFVRHKMLDLLGDLYCGGGNFVGHIKGYKTSHSINNLFLRKIFSDPYSYTWE